MAAPETGVRVPLLWPMPRDLPTEQRERDPCFLGDEALTAKVLRDDAHRLKHPSAGGSRVVFDSIDPPPRGWESGGRGGKAKQRRECGGAPKVGPQPELQPWQAVAGPADTTLVFESRFESGNLRRAVQVSRFEYDLVCAPDLNTTGHTQWYFFSVRNARKGVRYKLVSRVPPPRPPVPPPTRMTAHPPCTHTHIPPQNVLNNSKSDSLYNAGMRPLVHSERGGGWSRRGTSSVLYYANHIVRRAAARRRGKKRAAAYYYTLTFALVPEHDGDTLHVCYCQPYTYTRLGADLRLLEAAAAAAPAGTVRRERLCSTLAGNACEVLTITDFGASAAELRARRGVVLTSRVHPGETNASWMMRGALRFLLGGSAEAAALRRRVVFKVVPMLNPDGVVNGSYRCNLSGVDLNRHWSRPDEALHPTLWHARRMIAGFGAERDVMLWCDMHGHSRRRDIFCYGCNPLPGGAAGDAASIEHAKASVRVFPLLLAKRCAAVRFDCCSFTTKKSKSSTARVVGCRELGIPTYTLEASFLGGSDMGAAGDGSGGGGGMGVHFSADDFEGAGRAVCEVLLDMLEPAQCEAACRELLAKRAMARTAAAAAGRPEVSDDEEGAEDEGEDGWVGTDGSADSGSAEDDGDD
jgi:hypothetical protein